MLLIEPRERVDDSLLRLRVEAVIKEIGGRPIRMQWQEPPGFRCSRLVLLEAHLEEPVRLAVPEWTPDDLEGPDVDRQRLLAQMPSGHDLSRVIPVQDPDSEDVTLAMTWCVGWNPRREGLIFEHAIGVVELTDAQRNRLLWWLQPTLRLVRFPVTT